MCNSCSAPVRYWEVQAYRVLRQPIRIHLRDEVREGGRHRLGGDVGRQGLRPCLRLLLRRGRVLPGRRQDHVVGRRGEHHRERRRQTLIRRPLLHRRRVYRLHGGVCCGLHAAAVMHRRVN